VNNAGIVVLATIEDTTLEQWRAVQAVNAAPLALELLAKQTPGRLGKPEDVAELVRYLGSDASGLVNGAESAIDAGMTAG
jgi:NAD(P)-dependent dehydrogenase (short-subunit alcohol dehydrogenase family)